MFRRLLATWGIRHHLPARPTHRLRLEGLEGREVPTVTLATIPDQPVTNNAPMYLPLTVTNTPDGPVSYDVTSTDAAVTPSIVQGGRSVKFTVTGKNTDGTDFTGDLVIRLFEDQAPLATGRIIQLVNQGYYVGKLFHRVSGGFTGTTDTIIQAGSLNGDGTGGSGLGELPDEFSPDFRFNSPGIVASANRGDDTTDQQFFIVRPTTPLANQPQFLNYNYTVLGILTAGADVYEKINATPLNGSRPVNNVTITAATVFADPANAVLKVTTQPGYTGTATVRVTPRDNDGASSPVSANLTGTTANPTTGNPPFLGAIPTNLTTTVGEPVTFSIPFTDVDGSPVSFDVRDSGFNAAPANVTVSVNQAAGTVTLTPAAGFSGVINLRVGVRDNTDRSGTNNPNAASNYDTQNFTLTVTPTSQAPQATVALSATPSSITPGGASTLTATVSAVGVANPQGTVEFRNGSTVLATAAVVNGSASIVQTFPLAGTQSLTAIFVPSDANVVRGNTSPAINLTVAPSTATPTSTTLTASPTATVGQAISLTAQVSTTASNIEGTVQFFGNGVALGTATVVNGIATLSSTFATAGTQSLTAVFTPSNANVLGGSTSPAVAVTVTDSTTTPPLSSGITAQGSRTGGEPRVTVFNADGSTRVTFLAFEPGFTGGIRTAVADVTGDGKPDIVVVPAYGGSPIVKVFDPTTGDLVASKMVFEDSFRGGLTLATGDTGSLGYSRVLVGAGETGGPRVMLYDFRSNTAVLNFFAYDESLRGGVSVAMGLLSGGTGADLITGVGAGGGPRVNVYDGATGTLLGARLIGDENDRNGIGVRIAPGRDGTVPAIYVNRRLSTGGTGEDPIDTTFVNFNTSTTNTASGTNNGTTLSQDQIEELLNKNSPRT